MKKIAFIFFFLFARTASAQVFISEIMYDPKGGDTGHEWVEVVNQGGITVDLARSKFIEGGSTHLLNASQGGTSLASNAYAIIADNAKTFLSDHSGFSGIVLDSSFSLKNTGETISFKMPDGTVSDTVIYTSNQGASGDGNSLQKIDSAWHAVVPTPGVVNVAIAIVSPQVNQSTTSVPASTFSNFSSFPVEPQVIADAGASLRVVPVGAPITFSGRVLGLKKEPIENARLVWSFGDGARGEGASVSHTYYYPGEYIVVLDAASGHFSASDRVTVRVSLPSISLRTDGDATHSFVDIENHGTDEIDLSLWQMGAAGKIFILPQNTILGAQKKLTLASEISGLATPKGASAVLNYPNGAPVGIQTVASQAPIAVAVPAKTTSSPTVKNGANAFVPIHKFAPVVQNQEASVINVIASSSPVLPQKEDTLWPWYIGAAFLGALALFGLRLSQKKEGPATITAEDFEIIEDEEPH